MQKLSFATSARASHHENFSVSEGCGASRRLGLTRSTLGASWSYWNVGRGARFKGRCIHLRSTCRSAVRPAGPCAGCSLGISSFELGRCLVGSLSLIHLGPFPMVQPREELPPDRTLTKITTSSVVQSEKVFIAMSSSDYSHCLSTANRWYSALGSVSTG